MSSLRNGETPDVDQGINPDEQQTSKPPLEETPTKFSVSTTNSVEVLSLLAGRKPNNLQIQFIHMMYDKSIYCLLDNEIH